MEQWKGFAPGVWQDEINVRNFIQKNYTQYTGDDSFLQPPTEKTKKVWGKCEELLRQEMKNGGVLDVETKIISGIDNFAPDYIDQENEVVVGLQTDAPLKRIVNLYGGMRMMLEELYRRGYRKMALLTGPEGAYCLDLRKAAYLDFLREKGLEYQKIRHMDGVGYDDAVSGTGALMDAEAILCVNDMMALGVVNELRRCGRSVPDDAVVTGFDDSAFATVSPVPIASVRQDLRRMAAEAVERILNLAQDAHKDDSAGGMIPCELVLRASVGENERL